MPLLKKTIAFLFVVFVLGIVLGYAGFPYWYRVGRWCLILAVLLGFVLFGLKLGRGQSFHDDD